MQIIMLAVASAGMNRVDSLVSLTPKNLQQHLISTRGLTHHRNYHQQQQQQQLLHQEVSPSSEHYIHTRLKSALGTGRKESVYSGVLEGGRVRRVASLNAQAMNQMLCLTESALPFHQQKTPMKPTTATITCSSPASSDVNVKYTPQSVNVNGATLCDSSVMTESEDTIPSLDAVLPPIITTPESGNDDSGCMKATTPESLSGSVASSGSKMTSSSAMKTASVEVVDVMKTRRRNKRSANAKKRAGSGPASVLDCTTGYVKRVASLNARACVAVLVGTTKSKKPPATRTSACSSTSGGEGSVAGRKRRAPSNSNHNNSKKRKDALDEYSEITDGGGKCDNGGDSSGAEDDMSSQPSGHHLQLLPQLTTHQSSDFTNQGTHESACVSHAELQCLESVSSSSEETSQEESAQEPASQPCSLENLPYNSLGLLYSGDCVHLNTRIFYTTEGYIPNRVIPLAEPSRSFEVSLVVSQVMKQNSSAARKKASKVSYSVANKDILKLLHERLMLSNMDT